MLALGISTPYAGEKEKCLRSLTVLLQQHSLVLFDLDPKLPKRLDLTLLSVHIGLTVVAGGASGQGAGHKGAKSQGSTKGTQGAGNSQGSQGQDRRHGSSHQGSAGTSGQQRNKGGAGQNSGQRASGKASQDPDVLLFQHLPSAERKKLLHGPLFSQGILHFVRNSSAYLQLLAEMHSVNKSNLGVGWTDKNLMTWLERILARQGSKVKCHHGSNTLLDDLKSYCRFEYVAETRAQRHAAEQQRQERERQARAQQEREQQEAAQRQARREADERKRREEEARKREAEEARQQADAEHDDALYEFEAEAFDVKAEAQLYLKIVRRVIKDHTRIKSVSRGAQFFVEFTGTNADAAKIDELYDSAFHDLEQAAERIRAEAARTREEAIRRAEAAYAAQYAQAFEEAVKQYRA